MPNAAEPAKWSVQLQGTRTHYLQLQLGWIQLNYTRVNDLRILIGMPAENLWILDTDYETYSVVSAK